MDLFEDQGKELLRRFEVPVPEGRVAATAEEAAEAARFLGEKVVVKAQVQVGGRGHQGGVKLVTSADEAGKAAEEIFEIDFYDQEGFALKQKADKGDLSGADVELWEQKKPQAQRSRRVLVERAGDLKHEY